MQGIVRNIDRQRRVIIPKEQLRAAGIEPGDLLGIYSDTGPDGTPVIVLSKYQSGCSICGGELDEHAQELHSSHICASCILKLVKGVKPCPEPSSLKPNVYTVRQPSSLLTSISSTK